LKDIFKKLKFFKNIKNRYIEMDFVSSQYNKTIPSKSTFVPSDNQLEYTDNQTIRFQVPSFMAFIDPRQTYLKMKVQVKNSPAVVHLSNKCGSHSLISQLRIYDSNSNTQLETIMNYNQLAESLHHYSENRTIRNKRGITEAVEYTSRDYDGATYDNLPSRNGNNSMFYNSYQTGDDIFTNTDVMNGATGGAIPKSNEVEVAMRLYSGILGEPNNKMFPAMLTDGLRIEADLASAGECLRNWSSAGVATAGTNATGGNVIAGATESCRFGILEATGGGAGNPIKLELQTERNAGYNQITEDTGGGAVKGGITAGAYASGCRLVRQQLVGALNLIVGKKIQALDNTGVAGGALPNLLDVGVVQSVSCNANVGAGGLISVSLTVSNPNNLLSAVFNGGVGRVLAGTAGNDKNNSCFIPEDEQLSKKPTLSITDVELVVKTAQPPTGYIESLMKGTQTEQGATYDFFTWNVYRNNLTSTEQQSQLNIPALNMRATSAIIKPTENGLAHNVLNDNLASLVDNVEDYSFMIANKQQPTQRVKLGNLSVANPMVEQVALFETEKALGSSRIAVRNLEHQDKNLLIARSLARYGGVYPLVRDGGFQVRVNYKGAPTPPTKNKLFITYVGGLRRLVVGKEGISVQI
jgi:hypothetical protein